MQARTPLSVPCMWSKNSLWLNIFSFLSSQFVFYSKIQIFFNCSCISNISTKNSFQLKVQCSNIAYHSRYIADMGPKLLARLKKVIPEPKRRSSKWLSSSVPRNRWDNEESHWSSAQYHTNNLLSSVLFEETSKLLPNNALTIEVSPHGLLQAILKKSMPNGVHLPLTKRGNKENVLYFLQGLGK